VNNEEVVRSEAADTPCQEDNEKIALERLWDERLPREIEKRLAKKPAPLLQKVSLSEADEKILRATLEFGELSTVDKCIVSVILGIGKI